MTQYHYLVSWVRKKHHGLEHQKYTSFDEAFAHYLFLERANYEHYQKDRHAPFSNITLEALSL